MLLNAIQAAEQDLLNYGMRDVALEVAPPVTLGVLQDAETRIGRALPSTLRQVFLSEVGGLNFHWDTDAFGPECRRGHAWLLSPQEIVDSFKEHVALAQDARRDGLDRTNDGYRALVSDWPHWIPVFRFPSGDFFCLDISGGSVNPPIVFLEHDVMDQGPNLHGLRLARDFADLVSRWSSVLFADAYDWTRAVGGEGIDKDAEVFRPLLQVSRRNPIP